MGVTEPVYRKKNQIKREALRGKVACDDQPAGLGEGA